MVFKLFWAYIAYVLLLVAFSCFSTFILRRKEQRKQMHRDRELVLKENLSLEKMKQTQKKEIEALRNGLLYVVCTGIAYSSVVDHCSVERITER